MSRDLGQVHWILSDRSKDLGLPEHIRRYFRVSFHDLLLKNQATAVSLSAVTLHMMSNNRRLALVINDHLPIEEASGGYSSDRKKTRKNGGNHPASNATIDFFIWGVTYLIKNRSYMYKSDG